MSASQPSLFTAEPTPGPNATTHAISDARASKWELRGSYQRAAIEALLNNSRGIVKAPAGSGKTIIAARAIETLAECEGHFTVLWLANTREQIEQAQAAMELWAEPTASRVTAYACCVAGIDNTPFALDEVDVLVIDECHHAAAETWAEAIRRCSNARRIWGLSATPLRADELAPLVFKLVGPIIYEVHRDVLEREGYLADCTVEFLAPNSPGEFERVVSEAAQPEIEHRFSKLRWQIAKLGHDESELWDECRGRATHQVVMRLAIEENERRNAAIVESANRHVANDDVVLVLVYAKMHGRELQRRIPGAAFAFSGMTKADGGGRNRQRVIEAFRDGELRCLIATSLADEGLDVPRANVLILACAGRSAAKLEQRTGRVLRVFKEKGSGRTINFFDHQHPFSRAQSWARNKSYRRLGYNVCKPSEMQNWWKSAA